MINTIRYWLRDSAKDYVGRAAVGLVFGYAVASLLSFLVEMVQSSLTVGEVAPGQLSARVFPVTWLALIALSMRSDSNGTALKRLIAALGVVAGLVVTYVALAWILLAINTWAN